MIFYFILFIKFVDFDNLFLQVGLRHSFKWEKNDLIIYDREYPSYDFIYEHFKVNVNFVMRATLTYTKVVIAFVESGTKSSIVEIFKVF